MIPTYDSKFFGMITEIQGLSVFQILHNHYSK